MLSLKFFLFLLKPPIVINTFVDIRFTSMESSISSKKNQKLRPVVETSAASLLQASVNNSVNLSLSSSSSTNPSSSSSLPWEAYSLPPQISRTIEPLTYASNRIQSLAKLETYLLLNQNNKKNKDTYSNTKKKNATIPISVNESTSTISPLEIIAQQLENNYPTNEDNNNSYGNNNNPFVSSSSSLTSSSSTNIPRSSSVSTTTTPAVEIPLSSTYSSILPLTLTKLPVHLRRRTTSHYSYRMPSRRRLFASNKNITTVSNTATANNNEEKSVRILQNFVRKYRRKPLFLRKQFMEENQELFRYLKDNNVVSSHLSSSSSSEPVSSTGGGGGHPSKLTYRLSTHLWHSKRFKMQRCILPYHSAQKPYETTFAGTTVSSNGGTNGTNETNTVARNKSLVMLIPYQRNDIALSAALQYPYKHNILMDSSYEHIPITVEDTIDNLSQLFLQIFPPFEDHENISTDNAVSSGNVPDNLPPSPTVLSPSSVSTEAMHKNADKPLSRAQRDRLRRKNARLRYQQTPPASTTSSVTAYVHPLLRYSPTNHKYTYQLMLYEPTKYPFQAISLVTVIIPPFYTLSSRTKVILLVPLVSLASVLPCIAKFTAVPSVLSHRYDITSSFATFTLRGRYTPACLSSLFTDSTEILHDLAYAYLHTSSSIPSSPALTFLHHANNTKIYAALYVTAKVPVQSHEITDLKDNVPLISTADWPKYNASQVCLALYQGKVLGYQSYETLSSAVLDSNTFIPNNSNYEYRTINEPMIDFAEETDFIPLPINHVTNTVPVTTTTTATKKNTKRRKITTTVHKLIHQDDARKGFVYVPLMLLIEQTPYLNLFSTDMVQLSANPEEKKKKVPSLASILLSPHIETILCVPTIASRLVWNQLILVGKGHVIGSSEYDGICTEIGASRPILTTIHAADNLSPSSPLSVPVSSTTYLMIPRFPRDYPECLQHTRYWRTIQERSLLMERTHALPRSQYQPVHYIHYRTLAPYGPVWNLLWPDLLQQTDTSSGVELNNMHPLVIRQREYVLPFFTPQPSEEPNDTMVKKETSNDSMATDENSTTPWQRLCRALLSHRSSSTIHRCSITHSPTLIPFRIIVPGKGGGKLTEGSGIYFPKPEDIQEWKELIRQYRQRKYLQKNIDTLMLMNTDTLSSYENGANSSNYSSGRKDASINLQKAHSMYQFSHKHWYKGTVEETISVPSSTINPVRNPSVDTYVTKQTDNPEYNWYIDWWFKDYLPLLDQYQSVPSYPLIGYVTSGIVGVNTNARGIGYGYVRAEAVQALVQRGYTFSSSEEKDTVVRKRDNDKEEVEEKDTTVLPSLMVFIRLTNSEQYRPAVLTFT